MLQSVKWTILCFGMLLVLPFLAIARIPDDLPCSNCHTMHNSQASLEMGLLVAQPYLLVNNCIGCHQGEAADTMLNLIPAPIVFHTVEPNTIPDNGGGFTNFLAGGDFYWVSSSGGASDNMGHNVDGLAGEDGTLAKTPPGSPASWSTQLTCEGTFGCHAATGAHHTGEGGDSGASTTTVWVGGGSRAASYRFLSGGIKGGENGDWEFTVSDQDHNVYWGSNLYTGATDTITALCTQCHGDFHGAGTAGPIAGSSPWLRHPTDISLNAKGGEFANYNIYDPIVPVAINANTTTAIGGPGTQFNSVQTNFDDVTCISCHRAHGSGFDDLLRWNYRAWPGSGNNTGCPTCHTSKD